MPVPPAKTPDPMGPDEIAAQTFPVSRRGFDQDAVRAFLAGLARSTREMQHREASLRRRLADAEQRAESPVLDEETLSAAVGSETARVLLAAHEAGREVLARAEARAGELLSEATAIREGSEREAQVAADALASRSQAEYAAMLESAKADCRAMVEEARGARRRILADLADRRRAMHIQLEQLRAGKDALTEVVDATARAVEDVRLRLAGSEAEARVAADQAARVAAFDHGDISLEALVDESLALLGPLLDTGDLAPVEVPVLVPDPAPAGEGDPVDGPVVAPGPPPSIDGEPAREGLQTVAPVLVAHPRADEGMRRTEAADRSDDPAAEAEPAQIAGSAPDSAPTTVDGEPEVGSGAGDQTVVDDLFARIRASRADEGEHAGLTQDQSPDAISDGEVLGETAAANVSTSPDVVAGGGDPGEDEGPDVFGSHLDGDEEVLARRDEVLAPLLLELSRTLKRELRSDQNELLDALRSLQRGVAAGDLVPGEPTKARLAAATVPTLVAAWSAGVGFGAASGYLEDVAADETSRALAGEWAPQTAQIARELADEVVSSLRERLEGVLSSVEEDGSTAEVVGAAYRLWRGERVEDLGAHYATKTFTAGVLAGTSQGGLVRWIVDDGKDHCPDCDDNALAGPLGVGELFPTGQAHPPAHPGCRCTLVRTDP